MTVHIITPDVFTGDITGNIAQKRGRILGMSSEEGLQVLDVEVPAAEIGRYATELRAITQGRGTYDVSFARYEAVPSNVQNELVQKYQ